jgi:hypothetical protein
VARRFASILGGWKLIFAETKAPWEKEAPKKAGKKKLTPALKTKAKARAKKAGRPYPNLVDNMAVAKKGK